MNHPFRVHTLGEEIYKDIESNEYLNEIYDNLLYNYSIHLLHLNEVKHLEDKPVNLEHALRFADILSNSIGTKNSDYHKTWAQEIIAMLGALYPDNDDVKYFMGSVLSKASNYRGRRFLVPDYEEKTLLERLYLEYDMEFLALPTDPEERFFPAQKMAYENFGKQYFSYSAPTSMGKSFLMRVFVEQQIKEDAKNNYAIIVPTKALINEISSKLIHDLNKLLTEKDYRVITSIGSAALEQQHNYILVMTPERMMYLLIKNHNLKVDYMFIDEAHKITSHDKRSTIYYNIVEMLTSRESRPHIIFASPNVPNPEVFLELVPGADILENNMAMKYSPVSQFLYLVDFVDHSVRLYNRHAKKYTDLVSMADHAGLHTLIHFLSERNAKKPKQNLIYCSSKDRTVEYAQAFSKTLKPLHNDKLDALAKEIKNEVHGQYYLAELIEKGVAYHIGYLPADIRLRIEEYYRERLITTLFCTSTLIEGVNLPADNLFITSFKSGLSQFTVVDFKNLMGRVGRIEYNLYGNVFVVRLEEKLPTEKFRELIEQEVPRQKLSVSTELSGPQKELIIQQLEKGEVEFKRYPKKQSEDDYDLMRKFGLHLAKDIIFGRNSRVFQEFASLLTPERIENIKEAFADRSFKPDDDITISSDQRESLHEAIRDGMHYPEFDDNGRVDFDEVKKFMHRLLKIFKWDVYERNTLGRFSKRKHEYSMLNWYTVILLQWIQGFGLSNIIAKAIEDKRINSREVMIRYGEWEPYDGSRRHNNCIIAETLEAIDDVILFRISNYFLKFSEECIRQKGSIENDWYEFVEYGTTNKLRIMLQKCDFSREATEYICKHQAEYVDMSSGTPKLRTSIFQCGSEVTLHDLEDVQFNYPDLFVK